MKQQKKQVKPPPGPPTWREGPQFPPKILKRIREQEKEKKEKENK